MLRSATLQRAFQCLTAQSSERSLKRRATFCQRLAMKRTERLNVSQPAGFSLIEIILVLGLIAFAATVMITNLASLVGREDNQSAEETLFAAVRKARFIAASERTTTQLYFDKESNRLQISSGNSEVESFPLDKSFTEDRSAEIRFYLIPSSRGLSPIKTANRTNLETKAVEFAPDRSASPFVVEIDSGSGTPNRLQFDPFSSLVITAK